MHHNKEERAQCALLFSFVPIFEAQADCKTGDDRTALDQLTDLDARD